MEAVNCLECGGVLEVVDARITCRQCGATEGLVTIAQRNRAQVITEAHRSGRPIRSVRRPSRRRRAELIASNPALFDPVLPSPRPVPPAPAPRRPVRDRMEPRRPPAAPPEPMKVRCQACNRKPVVLGQRFVCPGCGDTIMTVPFKVAIDRLFPGTTLET